MFNCSGVAGVVICGAVLRVRFAFTAGPGARARFPIAPSLAAQKSSTISSTPSHPFSHFPFRSSLSIVFQRLFDLARLTFGALPTMSSSLRPSTIAAISVGTIVTGALAYAVYFDHRRRTDPDFRKALKRDSKKQARAAKEEAEAHGKEQKKAIQDAVARANEEGFPKDPEEVEAYFMQEVAQGEGMCQSGRRSQCDTHVGRANADSVQVRIR